MWPPPPRPPWAACTGRAMLMIRTTTASTASTRLLITDPHEQGPDLRDAEREHERGQGRGERHTADGEADPGQACLDQRRDDDAERHAPNGLRGEPGRVFTPRSRQASSEATHAVGRRLTR